MEVLATMDAPSTTRLRFLLLAPSYESVTSSLPVPKVDQRSYNFLISSLQKFRGRIYLKDGAIRRSQTDTAGRFRMEKDEISWHLLLVTPEHAIAGCVRYLLHPSNVTFDNLMLRHAEIANDRQLGGKVRHAVESELRIARAEAVAFAELGGWAIAESFRGTLAALKMLLASYAWAKLIGGCRSACTATVRHDSASILRRIGGSSFEYYGQQLPPYNDPAYGCMMELLRFDSRYPNPRFLPLVRDIEVELAAATVITGSHPKEAMNDNRGDLRVA